MPLAVRSLLTVLPNIELIGNIAINIKEILHIVPLDQGGCAVLYKRKVQPVIFSGEAGESFINAILESRENVLPTILIQNKESQLIEDAFIAVKTEDENTVWMTTTEIKEYLESKYDTKLKLKSVGVYMRARFLRKSKSNGDNKAYGYVFKLVDDNNLHCENK